MVVWHIETDFVALAIFIVLLIKAAILNKQKDFTDRTFSIALILGTASTLVDIFSSVMMNELVNWWLYEISMIIYGLFSPVMTIVWVCYTISLLYAGNERRAKRINSIFLVIYAMYALVIITNPIHTLYFSLSPEMEYARGALFIPLIVGSQLFYAAIGALLILINWKRTESPVIFSMLLFLYIFTTSSYFIQLAFPGWLIICSCYAIAFFICDATLESQRRNALYRSITQSLEQIQKDYQKGLEYQEKLKEATAEANRANLAKSNFLSRMSHDIRTPMNGIRGMLEIIRKERHDEARVDDCLNKIETASGYLLSLINDVLDMSKLESGELVLTQVPFNLQELLNECYDISLPLTLEHGIELICDMDQDLAHPYLIGSPLHVRQVVMNIVSNAIKYTNPGGSVRCLLHEVSADDEKVVYQFSISDTGIGISPEFLPQLFEPFSQEHESPHSHYEGTGLGLAIVKRILERMGGDIQVESEPGVGSTFTFTIPFVIDPNPNAQAQAAGSDGTHTDLSGYHLLLVEDNELNLEIAQFILENSGAKVDTAVNGQEAVNLFQKAPAFAYDAILMDIMMPVLNGLDATKQIRAMDRQDAKRIPIIAMTANAFAEDAARCREAGMTVHLTKPLDSALLNRTLKIYIEKNRAE